jgi:hypothetical protein
MEHAEAELLRQNEAYDRTVKDLEYRCRYLEDLNTRSKSPVNRRSNDLKNSKNSQKTVSFRKSRSKSRTDKFKTSKSTSPSSPLLSKPQNRHIGAHLLESGEFSDKINKMELELEELNKHYKRLLSTSKSETNGLSKIRIEIDRLAAELENKGKMISNLKKQANMDRKE